MGNLTKNLSRHEFACECECGFDTVDGQDIVIQDVADHIATEDGIDIRIDITGPNRCIAHNEEVQKKHNPSYVSFSSKSTHIWGRAADFKLFNRRTGVQIGPDRVADYLEKKYPTQYGIGRYRNRTHFDTRTNGPARWEVR